MTGVSNIGAQEEEGAMPETDEGTLSVLSRVREDRKKLGEQSTPLDLAVPGFSGALVIRYRWIPYTALSKNAKSLAKIEEVSEQQIFAAADVIVSCAQELLLLVNGKLVPFPNVEKMSFASPELSAALDFPQQDTAINTVKAVFSNDYAMMVQAGTVTEWLQDTTLKINKGFSEN